MSSAEAPHGDRSGRRIAGRRHHAPRGAAGVRDDCDRRATGRGAGRIVPRNRSTIRSHVCGLPRSLRDDRARAVAAREGRSMKRTTDDTPLLTALEQLAPHDHLCSIYESREEHFAVAIPFIRIGLDRGEKCIYIADDGTEADVRDAMSAGGIDAERAIATGSLVLEKKENAYLKNGSFDPDWMITFWADATAEATRQGFSALRATGETEWVLRGAPGLERWMEYESRMTHVLAQHNCFALCQYNRRLFPPDLVLDVIRTHPTVIYRGVVCRNMYHVPADDLLGTSQAAREVERLLTNIREREEIQDTL